MTLGTLVPPVPQAAAAVDKTPLVSVWTHLVPAPPRDVTAKLVVVAEVPVAFANVKFCKVVEA